MIFDGYSEQDRPFQCPECETEMTMEHCIGIGEYPKGGFRSSMKPNNTKAVGFECPSCFEKSCFHDNGSFEELYKDCLAVRDLKHKQVNDKYI